jgi:putative methionine-R-sulfoxide reductase with GAF domain/PAS domain-containing protein
MPIAELLHTLSDVEGATPDQRATVERIIAELAEVQVAHEELLVAEEQMRLQQEQITQLLLQHDAERRWRGQMSALVPVGLCVTDGSGALVDANPALAAHLGVGLHRLRGKPLTVFLDRTDVPEFRTTLRALAAGTATEHRLSITVLPRHRRPIEVHLFGFTETADHQTSIARIQWVLVPDDAVSAVVDEPEAAPEIPVGAAGSPVEDDELIPASAVIGLATSLAELSALPVEEMDRQKLLGRMATLVRGAVPGAEWVSITMGSPREPQRLGSDSTEAQEFDGRQVRADQGPCWDAHRAAAVVITDDVTTDPRWPALAPIAREGAVRSVIALPVQDDGTTIGVVNAYAGRAGAFGPSARHIAVLATAAVAGVLQNVAERESMRALAANLERALTSRAVIDQAKGMIMARLGVDADDAIARLVNVSSRLNVKLRDLAALVVEGHVDAVLHAAD